MKVKDPSLARALGPVAVCVQECRAQGHLPQGRVHVAVSGGADSTLLFLLLHQLRRRLDLTLSIGHVDHGLRKASGAEAQWVQDFAERHEVPCFVERIELRPGGDLAARARKARRKVLQEQAARVQSAVIALGHTATDQVETMLMHASRGAGLSGLGAMAGWNPPYLRPLLHLSRPQVQDLAARVLPAFVSDPSNRDPRHPRVRVRQSVLPVLRELNPKVEEAWVRLAQQAREAQTALERWAQQEEQGRVTPPHEIDVSDLDLLPMAVSQLVLRRAMAGLGVSISELRHGVLRKICESARYRAALAAGRCQPPAGGLGPLRFDLHPHGHLTVQRTKIMIFTQARR